jgi:hypothetical protein
MCDKDIQQTAKFTREFLVMSLIPWMEKCVVEWNENVIRNSCVMCKAGGRLTYILVLVHSTLAI